MFTPIAVYCLGYNITVVSQYKVVFESQESHKYESEKDKNLVYCYAFDVTSYFFDAFIIFIS